MFDLAQVKVFSMTTSHSPTDASPEAVPALPPHVLVIFGATGSLSRRKLLPGVLHLARAGLLPECRIIGTSLEDIDEQEFREFAWDACNQFARHKVTEAEWADFSKRLSYIPQAAGPSGLSDLVRRIEAELPGTPQRLHYLSVPPIAAPAVVKILAEADLTKAGLTRARAETIRALARAVCEGRIRFEGIVETDAFLARLCEIQGIGAWTAQYVAMRALGEPDAFPAGDLGLLRALNLTSSRELERRSEAWRPWRAYATMYLWNGFCDGKARGSKSAISKTQKASIERVEPRHAVCPVV